jgi:hypothetical protein
MPFNTNKSMFKKKKEVYDPTHCLSRGRSGSAVCGPGVTEPVCCQDYNSLNRMSLLGSFSQELVQKATASSISPYYLNRKGEFSQR